MRWNRGLSSGLLLLLIICLLFLPGCSSRDDPEKAVIYYEKSLKAKTQGDIDGEIKYLSMAVKYDSQNVEYTLKLVEKLINKGNYEKAENIILKTLKTNPENLELRMMAGITYIQWVQSIENFLDQGALADKGIKQFNYVLEKDPDNIDALLYRANTFANYPDIMGMHKQAEKDYEHLLELAEKGNDERFGYVYYYYGEFLSSKNRNEEALALWKKGLELYPQNEMIKDKLKLVGGKIDEVKHD